MTRKQQGALACVGGITLDELMVELGLAFRKAKGAEKAKLAIDLLPYFAPRLKAVDVTSRQDVRVKITIGGDDDSAEPFAVPDW